MLSIMSFLKIRDIIYTRRNARALSVCPLRFGSPEHLSKCCLCQAVHTLHSSLLPRLPASPKKLPSSDFYHDVLGFPVAELRVNRPFAR